VLDLAPQVAFFWQQHSATPVTLNCGGFRAGSALDPFATAAERHFVLEKSRAAQDEKVQSAGLHSARRRKLPHRKTMMKFLFALAVLQTFLACSNFGQDCRTRYRDQLEAKPRGSLAHFRLAECFWRVRDRAGAVNEFRAALSGDLNPSWIKVWSYLNVGKIFDATGQRDRALDEYTLAEKAKDNTSGAQDEIAKYRKTPHRER
jgi:hypothetical protein